MAKSKLTISFSMCILSFAAAALLADAALECKVDTNCAGYTDMFHMEDYDNAHASTDGSYSYIVCCRYVNPVMSVSGSCSDTYDVMLKLSGVTNAHAEKKTESYYWNDVCIGSNRMPPLLKGSAGKIDINLKTNSFHG